VFCRLFSYNDTHSEIHNFLKFREYPFYPSIPCSKSIQICGTKKAIPKNRDGYGPCFLPWMPWTSMFI